MTASLIRTALRRRYPASSWALLFEVGDGTGAGKRRAADAIAMSLWPSRGLFIEGVEIKISRSDWLRELKKPEKADSIANHCNAWWIATTPGVIRQDLPAGWGHLELDDAGTLQVKVEAAASTDQGAIDRGFVAAILRGAGKSANLDLEAELKPLRDRLESEFDTRLHAAIADKLSGRTKAEDILATLLTQIDAKELARLSEEDVARAIAAVLKTGVASTWFGLDSIRQTLGTMADKIAELQIASGMTPKDFPQTAKPRRKA